LLIDRYRSNNLITFHERRKGGNFFKAKFLYLFNFYNFARFIKYGYLRKCSDNFKYLTEHIIEYSDMEFTMFLTDDGYFFDDVIVPDEVFKLIKANPSQTSYRMYVGDNLYNFPNSLKETPLGYNWQYNDLKMESHWAYPFAVDATIYDTKFLLKTIKPVLYHMPTTLEAYVCNKCIRKKIFLSGIGPKQSNYVGLFLNRVSTIAQNYAGSIHPDTLNDFFLKGYTLDFDFKKPPIKHAFIPSRLILTSQNGLIETIDLSDVQEILQ
jgi:hypothetical protein